ncbi:MAG: RidA family protein [Myxococcales bacterium]|nr:RidA family protein [Myxococcales bacterium]
MSAPHITVVEPPGWPRPKGYVNGMLAVGRSLHVAGQVGWNERCEIVGPGLTAQFDQALANVLAVVRAAGGAAEHVVTLTFFCTDLPAYEASQRELGAIWRKHFGKHYPAMALIGVAGLIEKGALCELLATAVLPMPDASGGGAP